MIVHEQLSFQDALSLATKRIFETKGRSRRSEFWWAMLVAYFISNFLPPFLACDHTYINQTVARHGTQRMVDVFPSSGHNHYCLNVCLGCS